MSTDEQQANRGVVERFFTLPRGKIALLREFKINVQTLE